MNSVYLIDNNLKKMLIILSSSQTLNLKSPFPAIPYSIPYFLKKADFLIQELRKMSISEIAEFMEINRQLAEKTCEWLFQWHLPFTCENARPAILTFHGNVYGGLDVSDFSHQEFELLNLRLRILSGLYGILRPLDLMQPYRLEMAKKLITNHASDLYEFWKEPVTKKLNEALKESGSNVLIHLASDEYFKVIDINKLKGRIITPVFKESKGNDYKVVVVHTKRARGLMTKFIIRNRLSKPEELKGFNLEGYHFNSRLSDDNHFVFTR
jgi:cytoplasmic iron level regulating protein YaaA (DUF328/UPF0246 family)